MSEQIFEGWPRYYGEIRLDPGNGVVRLTRQGRPSIELPAAEVRLLADRADNAWLSEDLIEAAAEAERQEATLSALLEGRVPEVANA